MLHASSSWSEFRRWGVTALKAVVSEAGAGEVGAGPGAIFVCRLLHGLLPLGPGSRVIWSGAGRRSLLEVGAGGGPLRKCGLESEGGKGLPRGLSGADASCIWPSRLEARSVEVSPLSLILLLPIGLHVGMHDSSVSEFWGERTCMGQLSVSNKRDIHSPDLT